MLSRIKPKLLRILRPLKDSKKAAGAVATLLAIGLVVWMFRPENSANEEGMSDDDFFADVKPLGAIGVSDSASQSKSSGDAPFLLPDLDGKAASTKDDSNGPLFAPSAELSSTSPRAAVAIETAAFTQAPITGGSSSNSKSSAGARVTSNQPVWLKGTIEFESAQAQ